MASGGEGADPGWSGGDRPWLQLGAATCGVLALELATIRWMSGQIRLFAYFQNVVLLAAFLGMGLGVALGRRRPGLFRWLFPALLVLAAVLTSAEELGLMHMRFPDPSLFLWGTEVAEGATAGQLAAATAVVVGLFWAVAGVFLLAAIPVGQTFGRLPPLSAYAADLTGSLLGVLAMTVAAAAGAPPPVWLALGAAPLLWLRRTLLSAVCALGVVGLAWSSAAGAHFSPYNRIDLVRDPLRDGSPRDVRLHVNRDFHQDAYDLSPGAITSWTRDYLRAVYELPFRVGAPGGRALVVGGGTGNDVAGALRAGASEVVSVEIDPRILALGRALHPEQPYSDPRVRAVNEDARAWFERHPDERFDVVCYGLLDSHAMFSSMSSLRLDNYVYTVEGLRAAWRVVADGGLLAVSFSIGRPWILARLRGLIREATGCEPLIVPHGMNFAVTLLAGRGLTPAAVPPEYGPVGPAPEPLPPDLALPSDDWPFLYLEPGRVPWAYLLITGLLLATAAVAVRAVFGPGLLGAGRFDPVLFLMGTGFMLLETRMVTSLSLLFGSTWIVNSAVFASILGFALLANAWVARRAPARPGPWLAALAAALLAQWALGDLARSSGLPVLARGLVGGALAAFPLGLAGVAFSILLRRARDPAASLGSNLLGAMVGGLLEYASMALGLRALLLVALGLYGAAWLVLRRRPGAGEGGAA